MSKIQKKNKEIQINKETSTLLEQADGNSLKVFGVVEIELGIEHVKIKKEVTVADIKDEVLLGMDIANVLDVLTSSEKIVIDGKEIPCIHVKSNGVRKVYTIEDYIIPAFSEAILDIALQETEVTGDRIQGDAIIEPVPSFSETYPLIMATSLVDFSKSEAGKVRVMNPGKTPVTINKYSVLGQAESCNPDVIIMQSEDEDEVRNFDVARRLKFNVEKQTSGDRCKDKSMKHEDIKSRSNGDQESSSTVQETRYLAQHRTELVTLKSVTKRIGQNAVPEHETNPDIQEIDGYNASTTQSQFDEHVVEDNEEDNSTENLPEKFEEKLPEHLKEMYRRSSKGRKPEEKAKIIDLLLRYEETFSKDEFDIGFTDLAEHSIDTADAAPVKLPPRRVPAAFVHEEKKVIDELLTKGVIRESCSPWAAPIVLVRKKSGQVRPCVDYRRLNNLTRKDAYPLPKTQECLDTLAESVIF